MVVRRWFAWFLSCLCLGFYCFLCCFDVGIDCGLDMTCVVVTWYWLFASVSLFDWFGYLLIVLFV